MSVLPSADNLGVLRPEMTLDLASLGLQLDRTIAPDKTNTGQPDCFVSKDILA